MGNFKKLYVALLFVHVCSTKPKLFAPMSLTLFGSRRCLTFKAPFSWEWLKVSMPAGQPKWSVEPKMKQKKTTWWLSDQRSRWNLHTFELKKKTQRQIKDCVRFWVCVTLFPCHWIKFIVNNINVSIVRYGIPVVKSHSWLIYICVLVLPSEHWYEYHSLCWFCFL